MPVVTDPGYGRVPSGTAYGVEYYKRLYEQQAEEIALLKAANAELVVSNRAMLQQLGGAAWPSERRGGDAPPLVSVGGEEVRCLEERVQALEAQLQLQRLGSLGPAPWGDRGGFRPLQKTSWSSEDAADRSSVGSCDSLGLVTALERECTEAHRKIRRLETFIDTALPVVRRGLGPLKSRPAHVPQRPHGRAFHRTANEPDLHKIHALQNQQAAPRAAMRRSSTTQHAPEGHKHAAASSARTRPTPAKPAATAKKRTASHGSVATAPLGGVRSRSRSRSMRD
eukprot:TRINITY_DN1109_c1_g2_i1.p1 TRINITY_DN1109_c1_g2~~TRINITY_DN1109_c1_g2_i1.p1  ORF type:complete len:282 (+),score=83.23 TRINITY_DN1109_c1_g2_i1:50-895(+)